MEGLYFFRRLLELYRSDVDDDGGGGEAGGGCGEGGAWLERVSGIASRAGSQVARQTAPPLRETAPLLLVEISNSIFREE